MNTDAEIVEGIRQRDEKVFELFVDAYGGIIKSVVRFHMKDFMRYAEECTNDVLLSVWFNIESYDSTKSSLKNWAAAIAKYKCIDYKRKYFNELNHCSLDESIEDCKSRIADEIENEISEILACLSPEDRELFFRHYIVGEKVSEICAGTGKTENYFFNRLSRGRKRIRQHLQRSEKQ